MSDHKIVKSGLLIEFQRDFIDLKESEYIILAEKQRAQNWYLGSLEYSPTKTILRTVTCLKYRRILQTLQCKKSGIAYVYS